MSKDPKEKTKVPEGGSGETTGTEPQTNINEKSSDARDGSIQSYPHEGDHVAEAIERAEREAGTDKGSHQS